MKRTICPVCQGSGKNPCRPSEVCPHCEGLGVIPIMEISEPRAMQRREPSTRDGGA